MYVGSSNKLELI